MFLFQSKKGLGRAPSRTTAAARARKTWRQNLIFTISGAEAATWRESVRRVVGLKNGSANGWTREVRLDSQHGQEKSPHSNQARFRPPPIMDSILDNIGNTPLVRINKIAKEEGC
jgi:hypothetical protein